MSVVNTTIQELRNKSIEDKDDIIFTMDAVEDFLIKFAKENLNETSPNFKHRSNQFGKSIFSFVWEYFLSKIVRFFIRC